MAASQDNLSRRALWVGAGLFALALVLVLQQALAEKSQPAFAWVGVGAAAVGMGLLAASTRSAAAPWLVAVAVLPTVYLLFYMGGLAITGDVLPVVRLAAGLALAGAYLAAARALPQRVQYTSCVAALGGAALFFQFWEPPASKPVPIARPLVATFPRTLGPWTGEHVPLDEITRKALGADEYLNLQMQSADGRIATVFITYSANAMSNIPHVPWVCMTQSGFEMVGNREDEIGIAALPAREVPVNVLLFEKQVEGRRVRALMFQYFNVGRTYTRSRQVARALATTGSLSRRGSYLSQTQVAITLGPHDAADPMAKDSAAYQVGAALLNLVVPLLEKDYYPDLTGAEGG